MTEQIQNFRLKLRNTRKLKRQALSFSVAEAGALEQEIAELEKKVTKLKSELLQQQSLEIDIIGRDF